MRIAKLPRYAVGWYVDRVGRIRSGQVLFWTTAEVVCMSLSLLSLLTLAGLAAARWVGWAGPWWLGRYLLPVALAGAVGYLTNLIAVTMLFRPYGRGDDHPIGVLGPIWPQGLVPRHKDELAEAAGRSVAQRLLTPETIAEEVGVLVDRALSDRDFQRRLRQSLGPVIRERLPAVVSTLTPEILRFIRQMVAGGFTRENLNRLFAEVLEPWLRAPGNREKLVDAVVNLMRESVPQVLDWLRLMAERFREQSAWNRMRLWLAERSGTLDWEELRGQLHEHLGDAETRQVVMERLEGALLSLRDQLGQAELEPVVATLQSRASDYLGELVEAQLGQVLPDLGHRIADDPRFWRWLESEGVPALRPYAMDWLATHGLEVIRRHFDVAGRVRSAIETMDVRQVHELINEASARHLGAIQVLGYALGLLAGLTLLLV